MQSFVENDFPKLLDLLYDAALDPTRWQTFLDALQDSFGNARGVLHSIDVATETVPFFATFGQDPAFSASYAGYYASVNPYPIIAFRKVSTGKIVRASDYLSADTVAGTEFFNDWMKPQGITPDHLAVTLCNNADAATVLAVAPHASAYGRNRQRYAAQLQLLVPHIMRALEINRATSATRLAEQSLGGTLEALGSPAFLVGQSGQVLIANAKAEALMRIERVVAVDRFRTLRATRTDDDKALSAAIVAAATVTTNHDRQPLRLISRASGRTYAAWVLPVRSPRNGTPSCRFEQLSAVGPEPAALVLLSPVEAGIAIPPAAVQTVFGLSPAEARLASALTAGRTLAEYGRALPD